MIVSNLDEIDKHGALPFGLVRDQNSKVQLELTVHIVDVMFSQRDGMIQHLLEFRQDVGYLANDHGQG